MRRAMLAIGACACVIALTSAVAGQEKPATPHPLGRDRKSVSETSDVTEKPASLSLPPVLPPPPAVPSYSPPPTAPRYYYDAPTTESVTFEQLRAQDAEMAAVMAAVTRRINELLAKWKAAKNDSEREEIQKELRAGLKGEFNARFTRHQKEIETLDAKVKELRKQLDLRSQKQDEIIDFRLQQLLREAQGLGWGTEPVATPTAKPSVTVGTPFAGQQQFQGSGSFSGPGGGGSYGYGMSFGGGGTSVGLEEFLKKLDTNGNGLIEENEVKNTPAATLLGTIFFQTARKQPPYPVAIGDVLKAAEKFHGRIAVGLGGPAGMSVQIQSAEAGTSGGGKSVDVEMTPSPVFQPTPRTFTQPTPRTFTQPTPRTFTQPTPRTFTQPAPRTFTLKNGTYLLILDGMTAAGGGDGPDVPKAGVQQVTLVNDSGEVVITRSAQDPHPIVGRLDRLDFEASAEEPPHKAGLKGILTGDNELSGDVTLTNKEAQVITKGKFRLIKLPAPIEPPASTSKATPEKPAEPPQTLR